jgi:tellurite methyltransferase
VLEIACGAGRNSIYLAGKGFTVDANDFSDVAIGKAQNKSKTEEKEVDFKTQGLDFFLIPIQKYDSVVVIDYKCSGRLLDEIKKGLTVGGAILLEGYTYNHLKHNTGTEIEIEECYKPFELCRMLKDWNLLFYDERASGKEFKVRALAIKPSY